MAGKFKFNFAWLKKHPVAAVAVVGGGGLLLYLMMRGGGSSATGGAPVQQPADNSAALQMQAAQLQANTQLSALDIQGKYGLKNAELQLQAAKLQTESTQQIQLASIAANQAVSLAGLDTQVKIQGIQSGQVLGVAQIAGDVSIAQSMYASQVAIQQAKTMESIAKAQAKAGMVSSGFGMIGGLSSFFSDPALKENIVFLQYDNGVPIYQYNYKGSDQTFFGPLATDLAGIDPNFVSRKDGFLTIARSTAQRFVRTVF